MICFTCEFATIVHMYTIEELPKLSPIHKHRGHQIEVTIQMTTNRFDRFELAYCQPDECACKLYLVEER
jgi:hypothetical protein